MNGVSYDGEMEYNVAHMHCALSPDFQPPLHGVCTDAELSRGTQLRATADREGRPQLSALLSHNFANGCGHLIGLL